VLAFALGVAAIAALLSGLAPAFHVAKTNVVSALKDDAHGLMDRLSLRKTFVVAQVGFSFLLVVTTGLLLQGLSPLRALDQGFESAGVQVLSIDLSTGGYTNTSGRIFARQLVERIRSVPGIASATLADRLPGQGRRSLGRLIVPGVAPPNRQPFLLANWNVVEPGYFSTLRIPLLAGRDFNADDHESAPLVAIINESAARRFWPGTDAVGQFMFWQPGPLNAPVNQEAQKRLLVVGVARDVGNTFDRGNVPAAVLYVPLQQHYMPGLAILARQAGKEDMSGALGTLLESIDPNLPVLETGTLDRQQSGPVVTQLRVAASVAGSMGLIGLLLASIGIYGITAYTVTRRTREIGIRLSLGARPGHVLAMILGQGLSLVFIGAALGLVMSVGASRFVGSILAGVPSLGPLTVATAILVFAGIGTTACIVPALRATRIDPVAALRAE
jgi:predicted permease